jgi:arylsulfatase A-like enzyme
MRSGLSLGVAIALVLGFLDSSIALLSRTEELPSLLCVAGASLAVAALAFALFAAALLAVALVRRELLDGDPTPFSAGLGSLLLALYLAGAVAGSGPLRAALSRPFVAAVAAPVAALFTFLVVAGAWQTHAWARARGGPRLQALFLALPLLAAETAVCGWWWRSSGPSPLRPVIALAAAAALSVVTCLGRGGLLRARGMLFVLLVVVSAGAAAEGPVERRRLRETSSRRHRIPRVVLITVDTLRSDSVSRAATPALEALVSEGVSFRRAYSAAPWTLPALVSMHTGLSARLHGVGRLFRQRWGIGDFPSFPNLAERLRAAGYTTAAFSANASVVPGTNITRGFGVFRHASAAQQGFRSLASRIVSRPAHADLGDDPSARALVQRVVEWLDTSSQTEFFLWVHFFDPHAPYQPPSDLLPKPPRPGLPSSMNPVRVESGEELAWMRSLYDAEVRCVDEAVGTLVHELKSRGLYDGSLIVLASDHGEEFLDHGGLDHGTTLYDELLRIPFVVRAPGVSGRALDGPVSTASVCATVLDVCGVPYEPSLLSAPSLAPLWRAPAAAAVTGPVFATGLLGVQESEAVVFGEMKYIEPVLTHRGELYDLSADPGELRPLERPPEASRARELLARFHDDEARRAASWGRREASGLDAEETVRQMKALGYLH